MRKLLGSLFAKPATETLHDPAATQPPAPQQVSVDGLAPFRIVEHLGMHNGFPIPDWNAVHAWLAQTESAALQETGWNACERAWLMHLREALGERYHLVESGSATVVSTLVPGTAAATLDYMNRTLGRVARVLEGIARVPAWGREILIVFDDADAYYGYVSCYYPEAGGEFATSSGMHINHGCGHYVTQKHDLRLVEPVIAHEMTHGCLSHLPLPLWLNEGIAVNTERRLAGTPPSIYTPGELRDKHLAFWGETEIQEFWSGKSFARTDDGNLLSYDLASTMVGAMAKDWERFREFVLSAHRRDGGYLAAQQHLELDLGEAACLLLEKPNTGAWAPMPETWAAGAEQ